VGAHAPGRGGRSRPSPDTWTVTARRTGLVRAASGCPSVRTHPTRWPTRRSTSGPARRRLSRLGDGPVRRGRPSRVLAAPYDVRASDPDTACGRTARRAPGCEGATPSGSTTHLVRRSSGTGSSVGGLLSWSSTAYMRLCTLLLTSQTPHLSVGDQESVGECRRCSLGDPPAWPPVPGHKPPKGGDSGFW
jgi:hypothetical protein